jgi:hypothetical protein
MILTMPTAIKGAKLVKLSGRQSKYLPAKAKGHFGSMEFMNKFYL